MRRRTFLTVSGEGIKPSKAMACDVCLCNKSTGKLLIVEAANFSISEYPSSNYSPVGVVVIPGSHNVYGDGSCAVMSLKEMNYTTPDTGSTSYQKMHWGQYNVDISNMTNYDQVCNVGRYGTVNKDIQGVYNFAYLPSDTFTTVTGSVQNPYDKDTWFYYNSDNYYAPSPYNDDDTRNPAYYQTSSPSSTSNCLSDFDGMGNTEILCSLATKQSDWKTASIITNNYYSGYSPAACCCWRYHTDGTSQGDWYLPAMGELGYIMPKFNKINQTISILTSAYGSTVGAQLERWQYWSSSESDSKYACYVTLYHGDVTSYVKHENPSYVRAFLRVGA